MAFQQSLTSVPLLDPSEDVESSKPFLELRREIGIYNFGWFFIISLLYSCSPFSCPVHAVCAALMEWQQRFPVVPAPSWWDREAPHVLTSGKLITVGCSLIKILKAAPFRLSTACLSVENSSSLKEGWSLAGRGHTGLDTGLCNPLNLHWTGVGLFKSQTSFWCRDRRRALELHSRFSSAEILKQFIPWSGCCWVCWSCPFFVAAAQKLQLKEKLISLKGFLMRLSLASGFCITSCVSPSPFSLYLNSCLLMTSTFDFPELRIFKKCYWHLSLP